MRLYLVYYISVGSSTCFGCWHIIRSWYNCNYSFWHWSNAM